jgi:uncharacterized protein YprB with RNaseH-like and TPR domain
MSTLRLKLQRLVATDQKNLAATAAPHGTDEREQLGEASSCFDVASRTLDNTAATEKSGNNPFGKEALASTLDQIGRLGGVIGRGNNALEALEVRRALKKAEQAQHAEASLTTWYPDAERIETVAASAKAPAEGFARVTIQLEGQPDTQSPHLFAPLEQHTPPSFALPPSAITTLFNGVDDAPLALDRLLFIDTETTGLAGGAGTYAFLVGAGYFEPIKPAGRCNGKGCAASATQYRFVVQQFLMEDFCDEPPALEALADLMNRFDALVTFNGRTFDVPVLRSRFIVNGMRPPLLDAPNLDLMTPSQRFWREAAGAGSLQTMERYVLGFEREDDIDSAWIPQIFFDYARGRYRHRMSGVLKHNAQDIHSMALLLPCLLNFYERQELPPVNATAPASCTESSSWVGVARCHQAQGRHDDAAPMLQQALERAGDQQEEERSARMLALVYRRQKKHEAAHELWQFLWSLQTERAPAYAIEVAKHLEHRQKAFAEALELLDQAQRLLEDAVKHNTWVSSEFEPYYDDCSEQQPKRPPRKTGLPRCTAAWADRCRADIATRLIRLKSKQQ